jgi:hypothetical protein
VGYLYLKAYSFKKLETFLHQERRHTRFTRVSWRQAANGSWPMHRLLLLTRIDGVPGCLFLSGEKWLQFRVMGTRSSLGHDPTFYCLLQCVRLLRRLFNPWIRIWRECMQWILATVGTTRHLYIEFHREQDKSAFSYAALHLLVPHCQLRRRRKCVASERVTTILYILHVSCWEQLLPHVRRTIHRRRTIGSISLGRPELCFSWHKN